MARKLNQTDAMDFMAKLMPSVGMKALFIAECGCVKADFGTSVRRLRCGYHKTKYPRWCHCGYVNELSDRTHGFHKLGDRERVAQLRAERLRHFRECVLGEKIA